VKALNNVVTYLSMTFVNDGQFLQGLGEGVIISRDDNALGAVHTNSIALFLLISFR
jgi:hypothetical protein